MLRIYRAPDGKTWQYEEGEQPEGYEPVDEPKAQQKRRAATPDKARTAQNKAKGAE